ncbi:MAG: hypothetical protein M1837_007325 [Sclerophora amabilis]|nr:MAG: hypothetical protein M1837_007325 [Sclerophora amabilis]
MPLPAPTAWEKTKVGGKKGFDKAWALADKLGAPVNRLSNKLGAEAFWPTTLDKESDKAARILRSFCKDGFFEEEVQPTQEGPKQKQKVVIANAKGLAIFTTMRSGLWLSGAGGSGVLVARKEDGSWSPPSGIMLHTAGLGFLIGVDIYDCVIVINTEKALQAFTKIRCTVGGEVSAVAGPLGVGGILDSEVHKRQAPVWTYLKSRGFYAGVQIDGTVVIERTDENERFYGERIGVADIMAGKMRHAPYEIKTLIETIRVAQGDKDVDEGIVPSSPPPGDIEIERDDHIFGMPDKEDPDPYGVLALEKEGLEIREAGSRSRPTSEQFDFRPSPTSPLFNSFHRKSLDNHSARSRESLVKRQSVDRSTQTGSVATQTEEQVQSPVAIYLEDDPIGSHDMNGVDEAVHAASHLEINAVAEEGYDEAAQDETISPLTSHHANSVDDNDQEVSDLEGDDTVAEDGHYEAAPDKTSYPPTPHHVNRVDDNVQEVSDLEEDDTADEDGHDEAVQDETIEFHEPAQAAPQVITKARLVSIPKRIPPALPPRSPARRRRFINGEPDKDDRPGTGQSANASISTPGSMDFEQNGWNAVALEGSSHVTNGALRKDEDTQRKDENGLLSSPIHIEEGEIGDVGRTEGEGHERAKDSGQETPAPLKDGDEFAEEDSFHSIPTTPVEGERSVA